MMSWKQTRRDRMLDQLARLPAEDRKRVVGLLSRAERQVLRQAIRERSKTEGVGNRASKKKSRKVQSPFSPWMRKHIDAARSEDAPDGTAGMTSQARSLLLKLSEELSSPAPLPNSASVTPGQPESGSDVSSMGAQA